MPEGFQVDLDGEQVLFDGSWYSKDDLARKIKAMVDAGDYRVARPSAALEALQAALLGMRSLTLRLPVEEAEALADAAARQGMPVGAFAREILVQWLPSVAASPVAPAPSPPTAPGFAPAPIVTEIPSAEEAATAIPLTAKRRDDNDAEKDWFNRR